jgi:mono/diheme cytochrome c family protein/rhodanese-related sulfurtransferase
MHPLVLVLLLPVALACTKGGAEESTEQAPAALVQPERETPPPPASSEIPAKAEPAQAKPAGESGAELYVRYCALCHGANATGYVADNAPSLVSQTFLESATDEFIARGIRMGRPNTAMAAYGKQRGGPLGDAQIDAIVAYLRSMGPQAKKLPTVPVSGDPKRGENLFGLHCFKCHGNAKMRGTAPSLHNPEFLAAATPAFIEYAITHGRPPTPMLPFENQLSKAQIADLVAYLTSNAPTSPTAPVARPQVPQDLPLVINPRGKPPKFTLRAKRFVSADQVKQALDAKRRFVIIDARSPSDWIQYHIPGSVPIAYYETDRLGKIPNDGTWIVAYCACPHHASGEVIDALRRLGYPNTAVLDEGIIVWRQRGYQLEGEAIQRSEKK